MSAPPDDQASPAAPGFVPERTPAAGWATPPTPTAGRLRGRLVTLLKLTVAVALLALLVQKNDLDPKKIGRAFQEPATLALAVLLGSVGLSMSALRWRLLLRAEGIDCSIGLAMRLTWIGHFWNMVIPGAVSGDAVKMYYIGKAFPARREESWTTVFADRLIGMAALVSVSTVATLTNLEFMRSRPQLEATAAAMLVVLVAMAGLFLALSLGVGRQTKVADSLRKRLPLLDTLRRAYHTLLRLGERPRVVAATFTISFASHALAVGTASVLGHAAGEHTLPFTQYCVVFPVALFSNTLPLTPGGIGVGETMLGNLFAWSGGAASDGVAIMVLYRLNFFVLAAVGAILYVAHRRDHPAGGDAAPREAG